MLKKQKEIKSNNKEYFLYKLEIKLDNANVNNYMSQSHKKVKNFL